MSRPVVWLEHSSSPNAAAYQLEQEFSKCCDVEVIGSLLSCGDRMQAIVPRSEAAEILAPTQKSISPDLYLCIESSTVRYPEDIKAFGCPKACYLSEFQNPLENMIAWAKNFDYVFLAQRQFLDEFRARGIHAHWLPFACDPEINRSFHDGKSHEIGFVGDVSDGSRRASLLPRLHKHIPVHCENNIGEDRAKVFSRSKIVFNVNDCNDLNMTFFEALSCGSLLLSDLAGNSGQDILFRNGEEYALYRFDDELADVARFYLQNAALREQIAARGQSLVRNAHTWEHRVEDLLAVTLGGKPNTYSAEELRERSLENVPPVDATYNNAACISTARRSFVIPVLDMSPASEYNISTLLRDLEDIEGDVIVIFNGLEVAEQLKGHPRITRYAIMKQNVGVSRGWNLGLEIAATPTVFILNADLHVKPSAVEALERALWELPDAACVGPQGAFSDFTLTRDYAYFDKGAFDRPLEVDAISGFFFAVKLEHFNNKVIRFENAFTPCYFEELDLGLQIKRAGLKNYIIPTTAYDHEWSGTIRALREIGYYERAETAGEIQKRNRLIFLNKWRGITERENNKHILESGWRRYGLELSMEFLKLNQVDKAMAILSRHSSLFPDDPETAAHSRFMARFLQKQQAI